MAKPPDMRQWVTPEDLNVSPEVLGLALATPTRRLLAMLLDLAVIAMISSLVNIWWLGALALVGAVHARGQREAEAKPAAAGDAPDRGTTTRSAGAGSLGPGNPLAGNPLAGSALLRHPREWPLRQWLLLGLAAVLVVAGALQSWQDQTRPRPARHHRVADDSEAADALAEAAERIADAAEAAAETAAEKGAGAEAAKQRSIVRRAGGTISEATPAAASAPAAAASGGGNEAATMASAASSAVSSAASSGVSPAASGQVSEAAGPAVSAASPSVASQAAAASAAAAASSVLSQATALALAQQSDRIRKLEGQLAEARRARSLDPRVWLRRWADDLGLGYGFALVYFSLLPAWWGGQTVGKRLLRLRVVELTGKPMSALRNLKRFGGYAAGMATGGLGLVQLLWDSNRQAIQDKTAHTAVIDLRRPRLAGQMPAIKLEAAMPSPMAPVLRGRAPAAVPSAAPPPPGR